MRGSKSLSFIRAVNHKVDVIIGWAEFEKLVFKNQLLIQESGGYMTLVKANIGS
jgi:hypothetical protein